MLKKNDEITLTIDAMTAEGSGIGRHDGLAVFVPNTAVGDTVLCHIIKAKKNYAVGKAMKVFTASTDRVPPDCEVALQCGGCCYRHIAYEAELQYKRLRVQDAFERIGHLDVTVPEVLGSEATLRYRNKAQFPVQLDREHMPMLGFYAANSHRVVPCGDCLLQPEEFTDVLKIVRDWIIRRGITVYDEETRRGLLRHVYIRQGQHSRELMVVLVVNGHQKDTNVPRVSFLVDDLKDHVPGFTSLSINYNPAKTNVILGDETEVVYGKGYIEDKLLGCTFRISPKSFYQVNVPQAERLYTLAAEYAELTGKETLLDLYCGTGTIGLTMAGRCKHMYGVEIVEDAVRDANQNAATNDIENATFLCGDAAAAAAQMKADGVKSDVILVDPPRKGLNEALVHTIHDFDPQRIVYVSCDPATLARDCERFSALGWQIAKLQPVDLFPRTAHVETVVLLKKKEGV